MSLRFRIPPLTLAQAFASAAGAIPMVVGAARMQGPEFASFSVLVLVVTLAVGGVRAALLQPALIHQRVAVGALVRARHAWTAFVLALLVLAPGAWLIASMPPAEAITAGAAGAAPVLYEWARYRAIGTSRRWLVAGGDGARAVLTLTTLVPLLPATTFAFLIVIGVSTAVPAFVILASCPRPSSFASYRDYRTSAGWQAIDFAVGQFIVSAPLIALSGVGADRLIAGARLAQTLLGPLNLAFSATSTNILADGATDSSHARAAAVISRGWRASWQLVTLATIVVGGLVLFVWVSGFSLRGVDHDSLLWGLIFVGSATVLTGWAGIHGIVLRLLGHQASVTGVRVGIAAITVAAFLVGFTVGGGEASLAAGFIANGVSAPLLFVPVALAHYRRDTREP